MDESIIKYTSKSEWYEFKQYTVAVLNSRPNHQYLTFSKCYNSLQCFDDCFYGAKVEEHWYEFEILREIRISEYFKYYMIVYLMKYVGFIPNCIYIMVDLACVETWE